MSPIALGKAGLAKHPGELLALLQVVEANAAAPDVQELVFDDAPLGVVAALEEEGW